MQSFDQKQPNQGWAKLDLDNCRTIIVITSQPAITDLQHSDEGGGEKSQGTNGPSAMHQGSSGYWLCVACLVVVKLVMLEGGWMHGYSTDKMGRQAIRAAAPPCYNHSLNFGVGFFRYLCTCN